MPLIRCYDCGKEISSLAIACPACGAPPQLSTVPPPLPARAQPVAAKPTQRANLPSWFGVLIIGAILLLLLWGATHRPIAPRAAASPTPAPSASALPISTPIGSPPQSVPLLASTATPSAFDAQAATATPAPAKYHVTGISKGDYLNVRKGAGSNYPIVTRLEPGITGIVLGTKRVANGATTWQEISVFGHSGWANADYIAPETEAPASPTPSRAHSAAIASDASEEIRKALETPFEVVFETSSPVDGQPRAMGKSKDGLAVIELIGPATSLTKVGCVLGQPSDSHSAAMQNAAILLILLKKTLPEWSNSGKWLTPALKEARAKGDARTTFRQVGVHLQYFKSMSMVSLSISAPPPSVAPVAR